MNEYCSSEADLGPSGGGFCLLGAKKEMLFLLQLPRKILSGKAWEKPPAAAVVLTGCSLVPRHWFLSGWMKQIPVQKLALTLHMDSPGTALLHPMAEQLLLHRWIMRGATRKMHFPPHLFLRGVGSLEQQEAFLTTQMPGCGDFSLFWLEVFVGDGNMIHCHVLSHQLEHLA